MKAQARSDTPQSDALARLRVRLSDVEQSALRAKSETRDRVEEFEKLMDLLPLGVFIAHDATCGRITGNRAGYELLRLPEGLKQRLRGSRKSSCATSDCGG